MTVIEDVDSAQHLMDSDTEPEFQTSAGHAFPKWRILSLMFGLALGTVFILNVRPGKSLRSFDSHGITMLAEDPNEVQIPIVIRDFKIDHSDFERSDSKNPAFPVKRLVESTLGSDHKPVYRGGVTVDSKQSFDTWYNDDPSNQKIEQTMTLEKDSAGKYVFDKEGYFPIDRQGWKDSIQHAGQIHNYFFTLEMHHMFQYHGGEVFTFRGDDDLWVFINGELVIDLGGTHMALEESVNLDSLGLEKEKPYRLDLFFAERHTFESNFRIETNIALEEIIEIDDTNNSGGQCCLIEAMGFLCFDEKQWWTFWC